MKDIKDALAEAGKHLAEIAQTIIDAIERMTPEQRAVIEFLAENPEIAEIFQELNQKLARQRAIGGATKETAQLKEPLIKDEKTRKAIRAWAEANSILDDEKVEVSTPTIDCCVLGLSHGFTSIDIIINEEVTFKNHGRYTIAELCGTSKEDE